MEKIIFSFIICCNLLFIKAYAYYPFPNTEIKLSYIESVHILESALQDKASLEAFLKKYSVNSTELKTGDTALHSLSNQIEGIHHVLISSAQLPNKALKNQSERNNLLTKEYAEKKEMMEFLILENASPYIKNKKGEQVVLSHGFSLYMDHVLGREDVESDKKIYRVYLAGPEVFLPFYEQISRFLEVQVSLFNKHHLKDSDYHIKALFPANESEVNSYENYFEEGSKIYNKNRALMHSSHAIIANMTRHRDSSMDVGTAYEIGEMVHAKKTVVGYYDEKSYHFEETEDMTHYNAFLHPGVNNYNQENILEHLEVPDNLMVIMSTVSNYQDFKVPLSSWEALQVLKVKLDSKTIEEE